MIAYIHGILTLATPYQVIIEAAGVGYKIFITPLTYGSLPHIKNECTLHTVHVIREQSNSLYGFLQPHTCELFETLLSVTGIGPKLALGILGHMSDNELSQAIANEDISALSKIPGIGKKTAQRLLIEIRDKLPAHNSSVTPSSVLPPTSKHAVSALMNLGYSQPNALKAVQKTLQSLPDDPDLSLLIAHSLKNI
ncbi:MAG: Holliday junction branch migration protein RuvA [Parachlamydiales bacterium]|jgi:Holliday junction DNA helicase RuvA